MMERFKGMSPDEQQQFIARMKDRGQRYERVRTGMMAAAAKAREASRRRAEEAGAAPQSAQTIDALFAHRCRVVESRGRAWLYHESRAEAGEPAARASRDGTNTGCLSGELQQSMEVVTGVTGLGIDARRCRRQGNQAIR